MKIYIQCHSARSTDHSDQIKKLVVLVLAVTGVMAHHMHRTFNFTKMVPTRRGLHEETGWSDACDLSRPFLLSV